MTHAQAAVAINALLSEPPDAERSHAAFDDLAQATFGKGVFFLV
jgi:hypothetical protein